MHGLPSRDKSGGRSVLYSRDASKEGDRQSAQAHFCLRGTEAPVAAPLVEPTISHYFL